MWLFLQFSLQGGYFINAFSFSQGSDCFGGGFEMSGHYNSVTQSLSLKNSSQRIMMMPQEQNSASCVLSLGNGVNVCASWKESKGKRTEHTRSGQLVVLVITSSQLLRAYSFLLNTENNGTLKLLNSICFGGRYKN